MERSFLSYPRDSDTSYLIWCFETFYEEVIQAKKMLQKPTFSSLEDGTDANPGNKDRSTEQCAKEILTHLYEILDHQAQEATRFGGDFALQYYRQAQFVMASLADEIFLSFPWKGRPYWEDNLLESKFFGTHDGGDLFFKKAEAFLSGADPARKDLAQVYLLALGAGFQGKYRHISDDGYLLGLKKDLYAFIHHEDPVFSQNHQPLFPKAYAHTLMDGTLKKRKDDRFILTVIFGLFVFLLVVSHLTWRHGTHALRSITERIHHEP